MSPKKAPKRRAQKADADITAVEAAEAAEAEAQAAAEEEAAEAAEAQAAAEEEAAEAAEAQAAAEEEAAEARVARAEGTVASAKLKLAEVRAELGAWERMVVRLEGDLRADLADELSGIPPSRRISSQPTTRVPGEVRGSREPSPDRSGRGGRGPATPR